VVTVGRVDLEAPMPVNVVGATEIEMTARDSVEALLAAIPLKAAVSGSTGINGTYTATTNGSGVASLQLRPKFPGLLTIDAYYDANDNNARDAGEPFDRLETIAIVRPTNLRSVLKGSGSVDVASLFGSPDPLAGVFNISIKSNAKGAVSGKFSLDVPLKGFKGRSSGFDAYVGFEYSMGVTGGVVLGSLKTNTMGTFPFRLDFTDEGTGAEDRLDLTFLQPDGTSWSGGSPLIPIPRRTNDLAYTIGTMREPADLQYWPPKMAYGTVQPRVFHSRDLYFLNIGQSPISGTLDRSRVSSTYFTFLPPVADFMLAPGELLQTRVLFGSQGECTHSHPAILTSPALTGGTAKIPFSVRSSF
jgi:hypothetical protein